MAKHEGYLSAKESRRISKENRRITNALEKKRKRKNVPESEYTTQMHDPNNAVEFDNLHTYFYTDAGTVKYNKKYTFCHFDLPFCLLPCCMSYKQATYQYSALMHSLTDARISPR